MNINKILILISSFSVISISFGLSSNQTVWKKVAQLNPHQKALVKLLMKDVEVQEIDDGIRSSKEKQSYYDNIMTENNLSKRNSENKTDFVVKFITEPKLKINRQDNIVEPSTKEKSKDGPVNVILLLIERVDEQVLQMHSESLQSFPVQGYLQGCPESSDKFRLVEINAECDCEDLLRSNIVSLLSWAQHVKKMSTSALYETSNINSRKIEIDTQSFTGPQVRRIDRQIQKSWQLKDPKAIELNSSEDNSRDKDLWRVKNILTRLREAFFRTLLSNIGSNTNTNQQPSNDFHELATRTFEDLQKMPNENGYILVITAGSEELSDALELIQHYVQPLNTLIVVTSTCPRDKNNVAPFFARGPGSKNLINANMRGVYELPNVVRAFVSDNNCRDSSNCGESRVYEEVITATQQPPLDFNGPIIVYDEMEIPRNRFSRNDHKDSKVEGKSKTLEKEQNETAIETKKSDEKQAVSFNVTEKKDTNLNAKEVPVILDIQLRSADEAAANNCQEITSYSTLIFAEFIVIITNYALKF